MDIDDTRRSFLKKVGAFSSIGVSSAVGFSTVAAADTPQETWGYSYSQPLDDGSTTNVCQGTSLNWFTADWDPGREAWVHDMSFQTNATTDTCGGDCSRGNMNSTWWNVWMPNPPAGDYKIVPFVNSDYSHSYPKDTTSSVPNWAEIPVDVAVGAVNTYAGVGLVVDDVLQALTSEHELDERSATDWHMDNSSFYQNPKSGHSQRFEIEMPQIPETSGDHLKIKSGSSTNIRKNAAEIILGINFFPSCGDCSPSSLADKGQEESRSSPSSIGSPETMTAQMKNELGIKKLNQEEARAYYKSKPSRRRPDGAGPVWVATDWPVKVQRH